MRLLPSILIAVSGLCASGMHWDPLHQPTFVAAASAGSQSSSHADNSPPGLSALRHEEITEAARLHGYDLTASGWKVRQLSCRWMPDQTLLHYRRKSQDGREWLFTAILPKSTGPVRVVPVLYGSGLASKIWRIDHPQSVIPVRAAQAQLSEEDWITLAGCYAEIFGAEFQNVADPRPTLMSVNGATRKIILTASFGDRSLGAWEIDFARNGHVALSIQGIEGGRPVKVAPDEVKGRPVPK